jgi:Holliday junction resolvase RusA-like endonuclease
MLKDGSMTKPTKRHWINLNNYRNWHYQTASNTKILFKEAIADQLNMLPDLSLLWGQITLHYVLYPPNAKLRDLGNSVSIVDKYFADALVELGKFKDDNCSGIPAYSCEVGEIDRKNPRMEVFIRPFKPKS